MLWAAVQLDAGCLLLSSIPLEHQQALPAERSIRLLRAFPLVYTQIINKLGCNMRLATLLGS